VPDPGRDPRDLLTALLATGMALKVACQSIAEVDPAGALAALHGHLNALTEEPPHLDLSGLAWLTSLPDGLRVYQDLDVSQSGLVALPKRLDASRLHVWGCLHWDGQVPKGSKLWKLHTDGHPFGVTLSVWRKHHPQGEPPVKAPEIPPEEPGPQDAIDALLATGAAPGEAYALGAQAFPVEVVLPLLAKTLKGLGTQDVVAILDGVAAKDPGLARMGLDAWGRGRLVPGNLDLNGRPWVSDLPVGLKAGGNLSLLGTSVTALADGFFVGGNLYLDGTRLDRIPQGVRVGGDLSLVGSSLLAVDNGLAVGGDLDLRNCGFWNDSLPQDARVGGKVITDAHPGGLALEAWRSRWTQALMGD
jgi:hypothetical protein